MCGILGFVSSKPSKANATHFKKILYFSEDRGADATGIFYVKDDTYVIAKQPIPSSEFIKEVWPAHNTNIEKTHIAFGHTRFPTQGDPKDNNNNHPVDSANWVLVHNGSVTKMPRLDGYPYKGEVDSEVLVSYIEKYGLEKGLPYVERGTASVALINKNDLNSIYLWRETSPIILACDTKSDTIFFASQKEFLERGLANRFLLFTSFQIRELPSNLLIKISLNPLTITSMGRIEVMKYSYQTTSYPIGMGMGNFPATRRFTGDSQLVFNPTTHRWEMPSTATAQDSHETMIKGIDNIEYVKKYFEDHGFTSSEIARMTPETVTAIMKHGYNGADVAVTVDGNLTVLHKRLPSVPATQDSNKYYLKGMSKDFNNWMRVSKPNKGHLSADCLLIKRWDSTKKAHYIMLLDEAVREQLVDCLALQGDIDTLTEDVDELPGDSYPIGMGY